MDAMDSRSLEEASLTNSLDDADALWTDCRLRMDSMSRWSSLSVLSLQLLRRLVERRKITGTMRCEPIEDTKEVKEAPPDEREARERRSDHREPLIEAAVSERFGKGEMPSVWETEVISEVELEREALNT